ncbi:MAG: universal stress protein [Candidatus Polarisedimenticolaceae bacterium]|nr:universal stress protein [Candidatus Polarisedimenticolaceae bacterium]
MNRFKNILLVCNFDVKQHMAVDRAVSLAKQNEACLTVFTVINELPADARMDITIMPPQELLELVINDRRKNLNALAADMGQQGVDARVLLVTGTPFLEIIRQVLRDKHDLVILAAEGKGGLKERLFGSTSMHLMRKCPCPVWVVKPTKRAKYKRILAAVDTTSDFPDFERDSLNPLIMQLASSLAHMDNSEFHVVQVWSVFAEGYMEVRGGLSENSIHNLRKQTRQQYMSQLDRLLAGVDQKEVIAHRHLPRNDDAPKAIIKLAKSKKIDLLVMGTVCRTGLAGFFIGNTAEKVLSEVNCSVLTVKPEGFVTPVTP